MKLNLDFYNKDTKNQICNSKNQDTTSSCLEIYDENLNKFNQNIINWYPFKSEDEILEIGGNQEQLANVLVKLCKQVVIIESDFEKANKIAKTHEDKENLEIIVGKLKNIQINKKFDYIILIGITEDVKEIVGENLKLTNIIGLIEKYLKPEGRILLAADNKFGLRFFSGDPENILNRKFESLIGYNNEEEKIETFTKSRLEKKFDVMGYKTKFYYPLPDYRLPNVIFSDKQLPNYTSIDKYNPYHTEKSDNIFNEIDVFREILKNDEKMFPFFANSFLVEATKGDINDEFKYISFNNMRKNKYQLITKIADDYVEKQIANVEAQEHYENIKRNIKILEQNGTKTVDYIEEKKIKSKYINQQYLLNNILVKKLEEGNQKEFEYIINKYIEEISKNSYKETDYSKTIFFDYGIDIEEKDIIKDLHFLKNGLWDMTFKNCLYIDNELVFFDQEWNKPRLPSEYILYRSILYTIALRRFIKIDKLYEKYNLTKYIEMFKQLDEKLQEEIRDNTAWEFYNKDKFINIDNTKKEIENLNIRIKAQEQAKENIQKEYAEYKKIQEKKFTKRIKRKIKKIIGGSNE